MAAATREGPSRLISTAWVERGVEGDGRGGVDDDVGGSQGGPARSSSSPSPSCPTSPATACTRRGDLFAELIAPLRSEAVEAVVLDHLAGEPRRGVRSAPRPDEDGDLGVGDAAEDAFDQRRSQESGGARDEESLGAEVPLNRHVKYLPSGPRFVYHLVSGQLSGGIDRPPDRSERRGFDGPLRQSRAGAAGAAPSAESSASPRRGP